MSAPLKSGILLSHVVKTTRPLRDGVPFLLLIEAPSIFRCSLRFFHILHRNLLHILSPSSFAVCGHHLSPSIAIVFSLLSKASNDFMPPSFTSRISFSRMSRPPYTVHTLPLYVFYSLLLCHKGKSVLLLLSPLEYWYTTFSLAGPDPLLEIAVSTFYVVH